MHFKKYSLDQRRDFRNCLHPIRQMTFSNHPPPITLNSTSTNLLSATRPSSLDMGTKPLQGKKFSDIKLWKNSPYTARHIAAPIIALTMASLLFVYSRSSIYAAKQNAKRHREADGGQLSWRNESARRHGVLERPQEQFSLRQLLGHDDEKCVPSKTPSVTPEEQLLRAQKKKKDRG